MPNRCKVCSHKKRLEIDRLLAQRTESFRDIALRFSIGHMSIYRHYAEHLPSEILQAREAKAQFEGDVLLAEILSSKNRIGRIATAYEKSALPADGKDPTDENRADANIVMAAEGKRKPFIELGSKILSESQSAQLSVMLKSYLLRQRELIAETFTPEIRAKLKTVEQESLHYAIKEND